MHRRLQFDTARQFVHISLSDRGGRKGATGTAVASRVSWVVITLGIVSMLTDFSSESVAAILPLYITGVLGLSTIAVRRVLPP